MLENGHESRYRGGTGRPLVLLHGLGGTWRAWKPLFPALTAECDLLALTLPGHLDAPALPAAVAPTVKALTDWLAAELDSAGFATAHIVGNSLGGWLALELARRGRARSVFALAPIGFIQPGEGRRLVRRLRTGRAAASFLRPVAHRLAGYALGRRLMFRDVIFDGSALPADDARQWIDAFVACPAFDAILDALEAEPPPPLPRDLGCPVRIVWPANDRMTPEQTFAGRFANALPTAARVHLPAAGHIPMAEAPERLAALILEQVRGTE